jgi:regulator of replication initiation timing
MCTVQRAFLVSVAGMALSWNGAPAQAAADPDEVADLKRQIELLKRENAEARQKAEATLAQALAEVNRRTVEAAATRKTVDKLNKTLVESLQKIDALTKQLVQSEVERKTLQDRADAVLDEVKKLRVELATLQAKLGQDPPKKLEAPNPPPQKVQGKVIKLDKENLIQINVGSDHGLQKNHTLEVFRLQPRAEYLGMLRVVEVQNASAVGRMMPLSGKTKEIKEGDSVADSVR